ncbi:hypothetical protein HK098_002018 [Nowakowskiella sp. JEL0407]|nr:hypothetical protein HK098_002018 [Nowakowskiella sp. JEL0407]
MSGRKESLKSPDKDSLLSESKSRKSSFQFLSRSISSKIVSENAKAADKANEKKEESANENSSDSSNTSENHSTSLDPVPEPPKIIDYKIGSSKTQKSAILLVDEEDAEMHSLSKEGSTKKSGTLFAKENVSNSVSNLNPKISKIAERTKELDMDEHLIPLEQVQERYQTSIDSKQPLNSKGLTDDDAESRRVNGLSIPVSSNATTIGGLPPGKGFGLNKLTQTKRKPLIYMWVESLVNLFNIMLLSAGFGHLVLYFINEEENFANGYIGGIMIVVAFINASIEFYELYKIAEILKSFNTFIPPQCRVIRNGVLRECLAADIVPGDVVYIRFGDKIPADIVLFHAAEVRVDTSNITGESEPIAKHPCFNPSEKLSPLDAPNMVLNGMVVNTGEAYGIVVRTGDNTVLGKLSLRSSSENRTRSPLSFEVSKFCKKLSLFALVTSIFFFVVSLLLGSRGNGTSKMTIFAASLHFGIGILVAFVPQGLPLTVTMLLTIAGRRMADRRVLVKDLHGVETLGAITLLATDKTGTLTRNEMHVVKVWADLCIWENSPSEKEIEPETKKIEIGKKNDYSLKGEREKAKGNAGSKNVRMDIVGIPQILHMGAACTKAKFNRIDVPISERLIVGDATDTGLFRFATNKLKNADKVFLKMKARYHFSQQYKLGELYPKVFEIPFNLETKTHVTIHRKGHRDGGLTLFVKGAPEVVFDVCSTILVSTNAPVGLGVGESVPITDRHRKAFKQTFEIFAKEGLRVIAFAQLLLPGNRYPDNFRFSLEKKNFPLGEYCFVGMVGLEDPPKEGVKDAIRKMRKAGIKVLMVTGDHPNTAESIALQTSIISTDKHKEHGKPKIILGEEVPLLSDEQWEKLLGPNDGTDPDTSEIIFARALPQHKLEIVRRAQSFGHIVGVTGDGVNDAAALKKADLGIAMNKTGSDVSKQAASMILLDDDFATTVTGIVEGRLIFNNLKKSISYTLTHIIPEVIPYMLSVLVPLPLALTASQVLMVDLGFELFTTLSFAWDPPEDVEIMMKMDPRKPVTKASVEKIKEMKQKGRNRTFKPNWFDRMVQRLRNKLTETPSKSRLNGSQDYVDEQALNYEMNEVSYDIENEHLLGSTMQLNEVGDTDKKLNSRWRKYILDLLLLLDRRYWEDMKIDAQNIIMSNSGERLVDLEILMWSYIEAGLIECGGALLTYFAVLYSFGITATDARNAQKSGKFFKPHSADLLLLNGNVLTGDLQYEALAQAQSAFYLSIFIIQMWNLFVCKARIRLPFGKFMFEYGMILAVTAKQLITLS